MLISQKSIRRQYLIQLLIASAALIFIFSSILYLFIQQSIYDDKRKGLMRIATNVCSYESLEIVKDGSDTILGLNIEMFSLPESNGGVEFIETTKDNKVYLSLIHPFDLKEKTFIKVTENITNTKKLLQKILNSIFVINILGFIIIIIYAVMLSSMLMRPINALTKRLTNMNENLIRPIVTEQLPIEFHPLGET